jgi:hypothetical protein
MSVVGSWTLHLGWGCTGTYGQSDITFNPDGTFAGDFTGRWVQQDGTLIRSYDSGPARYGGTVNGNVGSGALSDARRRRTSSGQAPAGPASHHPIPPVCSGCPRRTGDGSTSVRFVLPSVP